MHHLLAVIALILLGPAMFAEKWPQWLGAKRDGGTMEKIEPWSESPKGMWSAKIGAGFRSTVIAPGRVFIHARLGSNDRER